MKREIITISGDLGSGKSSTADLVAKQLGFSRFSSGDFMRQMAVKMNISLLELSALAEKDFSIDKEIDAEIKKVGEKDKIVIDSRLAFYWLPESFKVYLSLDPKIAAQRISINLNENKLRKESENSNSQEEVYKKILERSESERKRYEEIYGVNHLDKNNYDLVIDTDKDSLEEIAQYIIDVYKNWLTN